MSRHVLSLLVEDKPGLLTRVAGLFARRGFNIESLAVGHSELEGLSRITVVVDVDALPLEQVTKQHSEAIAFANAKKEQALTLNGAILAYKAMLDEQPAPVEEESPCATGNCPMPSEDC